MRYKVVPEDFVVEEDLDREPLPSGPHAIYRLDKRGIDTKAAILAIASRLHVSPSAISTPALKDRQATATQHFSVSCRQNSAEKLVEGPGFRAELLGFLSRPLCPKDLEGNRFTIVIRDLASTEIPRFRAGFAAVARHGFPNGFDEQRFGSHAGPLGFPGHALLTKRFEDVLRIHFVEPQAGDPEDVAEIKQKSRPHFGDWAAMIPFHSRSNRRSVLYYLRDHPKAHKNAVRLIDPHTLSIYLAAYQSFLWNSAVSELLRAQTKTTNLLLPGGVLAIPQDLGATSEEFRSTLLALPSHAAAYEDSKCRAAIERVLLSEVLTLHDLKPRGLERAWLPKARRPVWVWPRGATILDDAQDERFRGRYRLTVSFGLPPGSYATLLLRVASILADAKEPTRRM